MGRIVKGNEKKEGAKKGDYVSSKPRSS